MAHVIKVTNPATGEIVKEIQSHTREDIEQALQRRHEACQTWSKMNVHARSKLLVDWSNIIQENKREVAEIMTRENGKSLQESLGEVDYATSYIDWYSTEAKPIYGRTIPAATGTKRIVVGKQPIGLVAAITPWNFPAAMMTLKAAPALAAGCTFVVKPAAETPLTTMKLIELAHEVGIPTDVLQYVN